MRRLAVGAPAVLAAALVALPLLGLLAKAPWSNVLDLATTDTARDALVVSLQCSLGALALCLVLGVPLAYVMARSTALPPAARTALRALVVVPMVLPPVVGGAALLFAFGRNGLVPTSLPFTTAGATVAGAFVGLPFLVLATEAGLKALDRRYEDAAAALGSSPARTFAAVTLPQLAPAIAAGALLAWARALGEFGATITFAGNLPGETQTLPLAVYVALNDDRDTALALSVLLLAVSAAVIIALRGRLSLR